jgi:acetyltransferase-like isoleucine patch superfamily enzyme
MSNRPNNRHSVLKNYTAFVFTRSVLPIFIASLIARYILRLNVKSGLIVNYTNRIAGSSKLVVVGQDYPLYLSLLTNTGIFINTSSNGVTIHSSCFIAAGAKIYAGSHNPYNLKAPAAPESPIVIGENCWLGANSVILPGVNLGPRTIVGAGAVVTKSHPEGNLVLAGVPARVLRRL